MTRPIEFRAWDKESKQMNHYDDRHIHNGDIYINQAGDIYFLDESTFESIMICISERSNVMKFTGLLDRNGKKIFEEDILKTHTEALLKVEWSESGLRYILVHIPSNTIYENLSTFGDEYEIIGNVYQNEGLLTNE